MHRVGVEFAAREVAQPGEVIGCAGGAVDAGEGLARAALEQARHELGPALQGWDELLAHHRQGTLGLRLHGRLRRNR